MRGVPLVPTNTHMYSGVQLTSNLDWVTHVHTISTNAYRSLELLRRHLKHCYSSIKETAYKGLVRPKMEYCSSIWNPNENDVPTLQKVQRRAARFVKNDYQRESSVSEMIKYLGWLGLQERRANWADDPSKRVNNGRANRRSTRQHRFRNIMAIKNCYRSSFFPWTVSEWNNLPDHFRSAHSVESFRAQWHKRSTLRPWSLVATTTTI